MHMPAFDEIRIFAMIDDNFTEHACIFHSFSHKIAILYITAVIGKSDNTRLSHTAHR